MCTRTNAVKSAACKTYGSKRKHVHSGMFAISCVTCPDSKRVESFLKDTNDFSDSIKEGDQVCCACYKLFKLDALI